ncbi:hypothetical protein [Flaviaesturariibacter terrae]
MKRLVVLLSGILLASSLQAQHSAEYASVKLEVKSDYNESANGLAKTAASYVLSTPINDKDLEYLHALQYLMRWMSGTPDYHFNIDATASKIEDARKGMLGVYLAAMTRFCLDHPAQKDDEAAVKLATVRAVLAYCQEQSIKPKGELKKLADAEAKGKLEAYLKG